MERLARMCAKQGRWTGAAKWINEAIGIWGRLGRRDDKIRALKVLANVHE